MSETIVMPAENRDWRESFDFAVKRARDTGFRYLVVSSPGFGDVGWTYWPARLIPQQVVVYGRNR